MLILHDDGRGFAVPVAFHDLVAHGHFGLADTQERVNLTGDTLTLESAPRQGTTVCVVWQCEA